MEAADICEKKTCINTAYVLNTLNAFIDINVVYKTKISVL